MNENMLFVKVWLISVFLFVIVFGVFAYLLFNYLYCNFDMDFFFMNEHSFVE